METNVDTTTATPTPTTAQPVRKLRRLISDQTPRRPVSVLRALVIQLRPTQWLKNLACLAGLIFSGRLFQSHAMVQAWMGFAAYCFASSSIYILNDFFDREKDRLNPRTASRPLASGTLPVWVAALALVGLLTASVAISAALGSACLVILLMYVSMNLLYTLRLKEVVITDVMCIALGFVLRVMLGVYAVGSKPTPWIVLCMFFLALFLGFVKRRSELANVGTKNAKVRPVLSQYGPQFLDTLVTMSATMAVICYATFTVASHKNPSLVITIIPVVYCVYRYMHQVVVHAKGESPDKLFLTDKLLWVGVSAWLVSYVSISYLDLRLFTDFV